MNDAIQAPILPATERLVLLRVLPSWVGFPALRVPAGGAAASRNRVAHSRVVQLRGIVTSASPLPRDHGVGSVTSFLKDIVRDDLRSAEGRGALHQGTARSQAEALPGPSMPKHARVLWPPPHPRSAAAQERATSLLALTGWHRASSPLCSPKSAEPTARPRTFLTTLAANSQDPVMSQPQGRLRPDSGFHLLLPPPPGNFHGVLVTHGRRRAGSQTRTRPSHVFLASLRRSFSTALHFRILFLGQRSF